MIQKIFITIVLIGAFLFFVQILNRLKANKNQKNIKEESIIDLEKDPKTDERKASFTGTCQYGSN